MNRRHWVLGGVAGAALLAAGLLVAQQPSGAGAATSAPAASSSDAARSAEALEERRKITDDPVAPKHEPDGYDVTIVSYSDYQCPFCRKMHPVLERLAEQDGKIRIVYRDWPIFGAASEEAAKAAIASQWQGKHAEFHDALMQTEGRLDRAKIKAAAESAGVNWSKLETDLDERWREIGGVIDRTKRQAAQMGLQGTPALLVGPYLIPGALDDATLAQAVQLAREFEQGK